MIYVGGSATSTARLTETQDFRCSSCELSRKIMIIGVGIGNSANPYFLNKEGAQNRADKGARKAAGKNIEETALLARCPNCGTRDKAGVRKFWGKQALKLIITFLSFAVMSILFYFITYKSPAGAWITALIGMVTGVFLYFTDIHWRWKTAEKRIVFLDPAGDRPDSN